MAEKEIHASIADSGKAQAGGVCDFLLGGNHNFEVDRLAAQQALKLAPYSRNLKTLESLIRPGKVQFKALEDWVGVKAGVAEATLNSFGFSFYGAIIEK